MYQSNPPGEVLGNEHYKEMNELLCINPNHVQPLFNPQISLIHITLSSQYSSILFTVFPLTLHPLHLTQLSSPITLTCLLHVQPRVTLPVLLNHLPFPAMVFHSTSSLFIPATLLHPLHWLLNTLMNNLATRLSMITTKCTSLD